MIDRIRAGEDRDATGALLRDLCDTMLYGSLCAHGRHDAVPGAVALNHFPEDFGYRRSRRSPRSRHDQQDGTPC